MTTPVSRVRSGGIGAAYDDIDSIRYIAAHSRTRGERTEHKCNLGRWELPSGDIIEPRRDSIQMSGGNMVAQSQRTERLSKQACFK